MRGLARGRGREAGGAYHDGAKIFQVVLQVFSLIYRIYKRLYVVEVSRMEFIVRARYAKAEPCSRLDRAEV